MQINRLFEIVYILLDKKTVTAGELAGRFGVSRRTICRDIDTLSAAGIPIYTERGKGGGIRLLPNFVLNKSLLNEAEQSEILSSLQGLSSIKTGETGRVLQKLSALFHKTTADWMQVDFSAWSHEYDYWNDFKTAILERRIVGFDYYNAYGDKTFRRVEPVQVLFKSRAWYLKGYCLKKQGIRLYKVSRIKNLTVSDDTFIPRGAHNPPKPNAYDELNMVKLKLRIAPEKAYRVYDDFHEDMVKKQPDGSFIATVSWPEDNWLYGFILSFGSHIEVIEPEYIRSIIQAEAQKISNKYT